MSWFQIVQLSVSSFPDYFARCMASLLTIFVSNPEFTRIITLITFFFPEKYLLQLIVCCLTCQSILRKENHPIFLTFLLQKSPFQIIGHVASLGHFFNRIVLWFYKGFPWCLASFAFKHLFSSSFTFRVFGASTPVTCFSRSSFFLDNFFISLKHGYFKAELIITSLH